MKKRFSIFLLALFSSFITLSVGAQTIFDVELVFFKRLDATGQFNYLSKETNPVAEQLSNKEFQLTPFVLPEGYSQIKRSEQKLEGVFRQLRSSANMRPLLHLAWRQPLSDKDGTPWLNFAVNDEPEQKGLQEFVGNIRFSRNQGLLVETTIAGFKAADPSIIVEETDQQMPEQLSGYFILEENRKVKINQLNYFDNPAMGILVRVTPYQASFEEQDALESE